MLPDYPLAKKFFRQEIEERLNRARSAHMLDVAEEAMFEGQQLNVTREDGSADQVAFEHRQYNIQIGNEEYIHLRWQELLARVERVGEQMGTDAARMMYSEIDRISQITGNRADAQGNLTPAKFLEFLREKIELDFDSCGRPRLPTIVAGPDTIEIIRKVIEEIEGTPELAREFAVVIGDQRERWRDRESHRKLVD